MADWLSSSVPPEAEPGFGSASGFSGDGGNRTHARFLSKIGGPLTWFSQVRILPPPFLEARWPIPASPLTEPNLGSARWSGADTAGHAGAGVSRVVGSRSGDFRGSGALNLRGLVSR
jgi:hypothetical protein